MGCGSNADQQLLAPDVFRYSGAWAYDMLGRSSKTTVVVREGALATWSLPVHAIRGLRGLGRALLVL